MKHTAGLLVYRRKGETVEVLIVHPGSPYFAKKDEGVWGIPKGEIDEGEDPMKTAVREFKEELGLAPPAGKWTELGEARYPSGSKRITAWTVVGDIDLTRFKSSPVQIEWPPRSGKLQEFPEVDRAEWHNLKDAAQKMFKPQVIFLERLAEMLNVKFEPPANPAKQLDLL